VSVGVRDVVREPSEPFERVHRLEVPAKLGFILEWYTTAF
jgi:hypothetical protein